MELNKNVNMSNRIGTAKTLAIDDPVRPKSLTIDKKIETHLTDQMNLLQFSRLYKAGDIPIVDFFIGYLLIFFLNAVTTHLDPIIILILTVPMVIIFNLITDPNIRLTRFLSTVIAISFILIIIVVYRSR